MTMPTRRPEPETASGRRRREPIHSPWLWVAFAAALLLIVPWWAPAGSIEPLVAGVPWWFALSFLGSLLFSALACWACLRRWNLVEDDEQAAEAAGSASDERGAR